MALSQFGRRDAYYLHRDYAYSLDHDSVRAERGSRKGWRVAALGVVLLCVLSSTAAALYFIYRDDALMALARRQTEMVQSYDAQLTALEAEIERLKSKKLIEQERVDRVILELGRRQAVVERRQNELASIPASGAVRTAAGEEITGSAPARDVFPAPPKPSKPSPISDTDVFPPIDRSAPAAPRPGAALNPSLDPRVPTQVRLDALARGLDHLQAGQTEHLGKIEAAYRGSQARARAVLAEFGVSVPPPSFAERVLSIGGPWLPFLSADDPFERQLANIRKDAGAFAQLKDLLDRVPVQRPVSASAEVTSSFGPRLDPFVKQYAFHSGIDLRGEPGDVVRAAAAGRVVTATYQGGYGLMVEVDHGSGLATRYGHLSAIEVREGQTVAAGEPVGLIGTTGRSTGPHLHYEVRLGGEPVDPARYLQAAARLAGTP